MRAYQVTTADGINAVQQVEIDIPTPAADEILVKMKACSLNYRDILITMGGYVRNDIRPIIPLSDGAGEVVSVGDSVTNFQAGDRVIGNFFQAWKDGKIDDDGLNSAMGGSINGVLADYFILKADCSVKIPDYLSYAEAATLPCAATTAWHSLVSVGELKPNHTVLLLGTGGVSIFGLQIAKALGAKTIITSSSDEKLAHARTLGADHTINYKTHPNWEEEVLKVTNGEGVDNVLEVGGAGTFEKSSACVKPNGTISLIGILTGLESPSISLMTIFNLLRIQGIYVGSTEMLTQLISAMETHKIHPQIDKKFPFSQALDAYEWMAQAKHFGKVVIESED
ncbi:NAD(P)-dependent alcohol dehydrogenase [Neptuniibacter sp. 2_MG-2023]|uniref:zinc-dependent alcohol dehydrogenase family protein n=1 Tax=Neptuniibacter sp. 2_MG-2023 TaxID=3062671 RepID=UPI0026E29A46|nr:NAD(P)-dependent alcohol dehydrogenase [Neptuniibacter sp. 2_MG-2023]MDO6514959.1 NAD(P)-dependent alcohol dehydrogenase [Neptuniibacter sp. 2_MG-2023]